MQQKLRAEMVMDFTKWEPIYTEILSSFSFSRVNDEKSARILASLIHSDALPLARARISSAEHEQIIVCGNAPCAIDDWYALISHTESKHRVVIAADGASLRLYAEGVVPDIIVTDLDGIYDAKETVFAMNKNNTILVIHAHGDNIPLIQSFVPLCPGPIICTTQSQPFSNLHNFGGFSDGDRAVFFAHALGAKRVLLCGFDLDDSEVDPIKRKKLIWARKLLGMLGYLV